MGAMRKVRWLAIVVTLSAQAVAACQSARPAQAADPPSRARGTVLRGQATYYGDSLAGHRTANGERYDPRALTAAHRTLPFGTTVRITRADGSATVVVRINDRGPFGSKRRILDVSRRAAEELHMLREGVIEVRGEVVEWGKRR